ncbi:MAG: hypothetical protein KA401_02090 [Anaerolineae bacterium]|nr:hypothetical protein [Chloroflexota bacterium]MBP6298110.1 hypothetical protein [Anaerolineae bacterium]
MPDKTPRKWSVGRVVKTAVGAYAAIVLIPLIAGIFLARADSERAAAVMAYFRDILLVVIFLAGILVATGVGILLVQLAALTGVVKVQAGALSAEVRGALKAVRGAATFISEAVAAPAIRVLTFFSGLFRFLGEITLLRRVLRRDPDKTNRS